MKSINFGGREMTVLDIVVAVCGIVVVSTLFMTWAEVTMPSGLGTSTTNITALDFSKKVFGDITDVEYSESATLPSFAVLLGLTFFIASIGQLFFNNSTEPVVKMRYAQWKHTLRVVAAFVAGFAAVVSLCGFLECGTQEIFVHTMGSAVNVSRGIGGIVALMTSLVACLLGVINVKLSPDR